MVVILEVLIGLGFSGWFMCLIFSALLGYVTLFKSRAYD
jgi:hypothetical protein